MAYIPVLLVLIASSAIGRYMPFSSDHYVDESSHIPEINDDDKILERKDISIQLEGT